VVVCGDYLLIHVTKSPLKPEAVQDFVDEMLVTTWGFFPEYATKKIIGAIASLYVDERLVRLGERVDLIVVGYREDVRDVVNQPGYVPNVF